MVSFRDQPRPTVGRRTAANVRAVIARLEREIARDRDPKDFYAPLFGHRVKWNVSARQALEWCLYDDGVHEGVKAVEMIQRQRRASERSAWIDVLSWVLAGVGDTYGNNVVASRTAG